MAATDHRFAPAPKNFRGKIRGGRAVGCTCGAATIVGQVRDGIRWHVEHVRALDPVGEESKPERQLARVAEALPEIEQRLTALTGA